MDKAQLIKLVRQNISPRQWGTINRAIDYSTKMHSGQKRASGEEYITHPLAVAAILLDWKMDTESVVAAILHDTVEDTKATLSEIEISFGKNIALLVDGVTKVSATRSGMREIESYLPKTKDNLSKLLVAVGRDPRVIIIKLADRLHNLRTLGYLSPEKQHKIASESLEIFARLADRLGMGTVRVEIEEISFLYLNPKRFQFLKKLTKKRISKAHARFEEIQESIKHELGKAKVNHAIDGRIKSIYSLHKKMAKYNDNIDEIFDFLALRIIVDSESDCYNVMGIIHKMYQPKINKIKDYIATPKTNGYRSLHTTVVTNTKQIVEIQIRTKEMHDFAEHGLAASFHYNEQKQSKNYFRRGKAQPTAQHLAWVKDLKDAAKLVIDGHETNDIKIDLFGDRVFAYTPKGDIFDLPEGAFPLDFAYRIHSDIGDHAHSFLVNGKIVKFDYRLQSGDVVEVKTKSSCKPTKDWIKFTKTPKARQKINSFLHESTN
jgi:guanosine-3',5'-bis(diphosphate) 3'-pyrophosphohydrolase